MKGSMHINKFSTRVITFRLAAALEKYELDLRALARTWSDRALFRGLQEQFGELRILGASLPRLSVSWVAVLVSRTRLLQSLCSRGAPALAVLQEHLQAVDALRKRCLHSMGAQAVVLS
jgi:hypothetical protein